ncbi:hypothetical protein NDU88_013272 [Pleurodeles waltl]|uniref:Uncharacterized protein n=1 Tax=Pleurodeles waltl TaxID=8319 RepID=A0AAV7R2L2_PLEWA|nr:hypothetical protein NDU88_013272 [Pleurodeles waltl]
MGVGVLHDEEEERGLLRADGLDLSNPRKAHGAMGRNGLVQKGELCRSVVGSKTPSGGCWVGVVESQMQAYPPSGRGRRHNTDFFAEARARAVASRRKFVCFYKLPALSLQALGVSGRGRRCFSQCLAAASGRFTSVRRSAGFKQKKAAVLSLSSARVLPRGDGALKRPMWALQLLETTAAAARSQLEMLLSGPGGSR